MAAHVWQQGGYKAATVSIMMFFLYIELLYIQLYHDSSCMSTGRIQSSNSKYYDVFFYILNYFIFNCIMAAYVRRQRGYKAATVSIMMFFLYIQLLYIQLYHGSLCTSTERIQSCNSKYYDVLSIYSTTLYPTVS